MIWLQQGLKELIRSIGENVIREIIPERLQNFRYYTVKDIRPNSLYYFIFVGLAKVKEGKCQKVLFGVYCLIRLSGHLKRQNDGRKIKVTVYQRWKSPTATLGFVKLTGVLKGIDIRRLVKGLNSFWGIIIEEGRHPVRILENTYLNWLRQLKPIEDGRRSSR